MLAVLGGLDGPELFLIGLLVSLLAAGGGPTFGTGLVGAVLVDVGPLLALIDEEGFTRGQPAPRRVCNSATRRAMSSRTSRIRSSPSMPWREGSSVSQAS